jgi:isopenicillin N synthase-like dioxygenase
VIKPRGHWARQPRCSFPFFLQPNPDFVIDVLPSAIDAAKPSRYPEPMTAHDYLEQRLREIGLK